MLEAHELDGHQEAEEQLVLFEQRDADNALEQRAEVGFDYFLFKVHLDRADLEDA